LQMLLLRDVASCAYSYCLASPSQLIYYTFNQLVTSFSMTASLLTASPAATQHPACRSSGTTPRSMRLWQTARWRCGTPATRWAASQAPAAPATRHSRCGAAHYRAR
jgi:hypothetical protein